ncbi:MAG: helix-turn-helix transcriptional regulator [Nitrosarchaeum sp.]
MNLNAQKTAEDFLEFASEQRLSILFLLLEKKLTISKLAEELDATAPEIHRNITRMLKNKLVEKDNNSNFSLTIFGKVICDISPSFLFISENRTFFENHDLGNLEIKFIQRLGALQDHKKIKGFVKVLGKWTEIHNNSEKYIFNILSEVPYSKEIIDIVEKKLKSGIKINSIFSESTIIPENRKEIFPKKNFQKFIIEGNLERKMTNQISIVTLLNEKEACIIFPTKNGNPDLSEMFYSKDPLFHDWCLDYFNYIWNNSGSFQEDKLAK